MRTSRLLSGLVLGMGLMFGVKPLIAQDQAAKPKSNVLYVGELHTVAAGKRSVIELNFKVADGFHVNSHTPKSDFLIPALLPAPPASGVIVGEPEYSTGLAFGLRLRLNSCLVEYSGSFTIKL